MLEGRVDDQMIEIGDPTEEPTTPESDPRVLIEYHERGGVPWMLIPPLLALSAVVAVLLYAKLAPRSVAQQPAALVKADDGPGPLPEQPESALVSTGNPTEPIVPVEPKPDATPIVPPPTPAEPVAPPSAAVEPIPEPVEAARPAPAPKLQGLGFDPKLLEAERKVEAPADAALAPVVKEDRPDDPNLPREIDPDLLPPDPREARRRQEQRKLEIARRVEDERLRFHIELRAICRKFREESGPEILEMRKQYDLKVNPVGEKIAVQLLGKNGKYAGADRRTRMDLLRSLGYPEPVILDNLFVNYEKKQINQRDGPRTPDEAYYFSALFLLRNPPRQATSPSKPVSSPAKAATLAR